MTEFELFDTDGYPTDAAIQKILDFEDGSPKDFVEYIQSLWHWDMVTWQVVPREGRQNLVEVEVRMVTGGWSGNESVVSAVEKTMFSFAYWYLSQRGGLFVYRVPLDHWEKPWAGGRLGTLKIPKLEEETP